MAILEGAKGFLATGGVVVRPTPSGKFSQTADHFGFTATLTNKNKEPRTVESIDFRIRTAADISKSGPAAQIHDGYHYRFEGPITLAPGEVKTVSVVMPVFITAAATDAGIKGAGVVGALAKGAMIAAKKGSKKRNGYCSRYQMSKAFAPNAPSVRS